jgi:uncharacterized protein (TIGR03067 family)
MKTLLLGIVVLGIVLVGGSDVVAQDDKALEGTWIIVSAQMQGKEVPAKEIEDREATFADGKMTARKGTKTLNVFRYKANATTKPRSIDLDGIEGDEKGKKWLAIYEINGDEMKLCISVDGKDRPTEFRTQEGKNLVLLAFKRKK